jgi:hypothetical protein
MFRAALYAQTLRSAAGERPDIYLTIDDDSSVDTLKTSNANAVCQTCLRPRYFLSLLGQTAPLFLVHGEHQNREVADRCLVRGESAGTASDANSGLRESRRKESP